MFSNLLLMTDSYKASHFLQYPPDTQYLYAYIESRGGAWDHTLFFGLQVFLQEYLGRPITQAMIDEAAAFFAAHGEPFHRAGFETILRDHGGYLPLRIEAVPEGSLIPTHNVLVTVVNTDPRCPWLTTYLETALLRAVWYPTTVATKSWAAKQVIWEALLQSSDDPAGQIGFKLHDFGARGVSSAESAALGGAAHLVNFLGSDTVEGVRCANHYYRAGMAGFSIPAAEHSTITAWGRDREADAYANVLAQFAQPGSLVAVVSDSYDLWNAIDHLWGEQLRPAVIASGATVIIRPDSGNPLTVPIEVIKRLGQHFGTTTNAKGYQVLNQVRVIQGDGIQDEQVIATILHNLLSAGHSADNLAFGMGGGLLQQVNRDTLKFAMKCSALSRDGQQWQPVYKAPITDPSKQSKRGRLALIEVEGALHTVPLADNSPGNQLRTVFENGQMLQEWDFEAIRRRAAMSFK
ncbi:MAG: nicotinate phosphoribosyltransferase [Gloeomargaritaceae cyanobacterium C42_A2020_066]|nr:nicotinate phosphoribosyltransferase [Gloeomargaritaceae cyanobacterium C42_A2020_066]